MKKRNRLKTSFVTLIKLTLVVVLIRFLADKGFLSIEAIRRALEQPERIALALLALTFGTVFSIVRWQYLLRAQDIHLSWGKTVQLAMIGNFFNIALPGAVSGDFVKAFYIAREIHGQRARAFGSILFDRVAGVSGLVLISALALSLSRLESGGPSQFTAISAFVVVAAIGVVGFFGYLFLVPENRDPLFVLFEKAENRVARLGSFKRIYIGLRHYHHHRTTVLRSLALSLAIHALVCFACLQLVMALGDQPLSLPALFTVVPLGLLVTAIPVAPAGVGTGHAAFGALFLLLGSNMGANVFSFMVLHGLLVGALGGLVYLRFKSQLPALPENPSDAQS